jgi:hypothetical protein
MPSHHQHIYIGSESDIIILSFVRSNSKNVLGFIKDYQRLNVGLTRARYIYKHMYMYIYKHMYMYMFVYIDMCIAFLELYSKNVLGFIKDYQRLTVGLTRARYIYKHMYIYIYMYMYIDIYILYFWKNVGLTRARYIYKHMYVFMYIDISIEFLNFKPYDNACG